MYLVIDIGGSKVLLAVFDKNGKVVEKFRFETPPDYTSLLDVLAENIDKLSAKDFRACAAGVPGRVDRKSGIAIAFGSLPWSNIPIQADLEKIVNAPVLIENDANLAGLSEALLLKDKYRKVLYVTVSTGIGGILVVDGVMDPDTLDAEVGQILLEYKDRLERWEDFASGKAIFQHLGKKVRDIEPEDSQSWYMISRNIAIGLIDLIATLTPDAIVLGGSVGSHFDKYGDRLQEKLKLYDNPLLQIPPVFGAKHAEEAVIYGAFELARRRYGKSPVAAKA